MKITLFTSNQLRHVYCINQLSKVCDTLNVVVESRTVFPGKVKGFYKKNKSIEKYFKKVIDTEKKIFKENYINNLRKIKILPLMLGDLQNLEIKNISHFLKSDLYVVFGSSLIKGKLLKFLIKKKAINIHMGVSPYYKGTDCNFWALYDRNYSYVGATIHLLSKGVDSGPILYHALSSKISKGPQYYSMSTVKSAIVSICKKIKDKSLFKLKPRKQNNSLKIRYSKKINFSEDKIKKYPSSIKKNIKFDKDEYVEPYIL